MASVRDLQGKAQAAVTRIQQDPTLSQLEKQTQLADIQGTLSDEIERVRMTHGYTDKGVGGAFNFGRRP
jgi:hypothetical protein